MSERTRAEWLDHIYARANHLRWRRRTIAGGVALGLVAAVLVPTVVLSGGDHAKKLNVASGATTTTTGASEEGVVHAVPGEEGTTTTVSSIRYTTTTRRFTGPGAASSAGPTKTPHVPLPNPIAFTLFTAMKDEAIWLVNDDGRGLRRISAGTYDYGPVWSPDGSAVVFWRDTIGSQLFIAATDGSGERLLRYGDSPSWAPDGSQLAFRSTDDGGNEIFVIKRDGTGAHALTTGPHDTQDNHLPAWSPDGSRIAFACGRQLCTVNTDGTDRQALTSSGYIQGPPVWSPDSMLIAFPLSDEAPKTEIYVVGRDGTGLRKLSNLPGMEYGIAWAPDSSRLAFDGDGIWIVNRDGTGSRQISQDQGARGPGWSPDGQHILFVVNPGGDKGALYTIEPTGEHQVEIVDGSHNVRGTAVYGPKPVP